MNRLIETQNTSNLEVIESVSRDSRHRLVIFCLLGWETYLLTEAASMLQYSQDELLIITYISTKAISLSRESLLSRLGTSTTNVTDGSCPQKDIFRARLPKDCVATSIATGSSAFQQELLTMQETLIGHPVWDFSSSLLPLIASSTIEYS